MSEDLLLGQSGTPDLCLLLSRRSGSRRHLGSSSQLVTHDVLPNTLGYLHRARESQNLGK